MGYLVSPGTVFTVMLIILILYVTLFLTWKPLLESPRFYGKHALPVGARHSTMAVKRNLTGLFNTGKPDLIRDNVSETRPRSGSSTITLPTLTSREDVYKRAKMVKSACNITTSPDADVKAVTELLRKRLVVPIQFLIEDKYKVLFCQIPKAGSTNVKRLFIVANKQKNITSDLDFMSNKAHQVWREERTLYQYLTPAIKNFEETTKRLLENYTKILFVRHPFERLVSYYRMMFQIFSYEGTDVSRSSWDIFNRVRRLYHRPEIPRHPSQNLTQLFPFRDFIQFVIDHSKRTKDGSWKVDSYVDIHWLPISEQCFPCQVRYDIIGKLETFDEDLDQVAKHVGIRQKILYPSSMKRKTFGHVKEAFKTLSLQQIAELKRIYSQDFKLFNYEHDE
ncbi:carbohydrate sulfotransferase 11 [Lingula anatina]|uniref:Carbohydrate sulfotransferase n=1 Tax=Lingula anatina TaxID=7574 RepID=A0A1S3K0K4_LINAN|nr:carbohydrate sulfotransferase 11 [Lingula anatina]|eukprot:XP_013416163.2 carbohydrate sulfotransferase 11 [Lingula anatina]